MKNYINFITEHKDMIETMSDASKDIISSDLKFDDLIICFDFINLSDMLEYNFKDFLLVPRFYYTVLNSIIFLNVSKMTSELGCYINY